ncbi:putative membrane protein [Arthrobacter sp. BE255]|nr:putative membrane protein [Arthrobacter sp. BE255]
MFAAILLVIAGVWSLSVWPQFLRRVMKDPRARDAAGKATKFLTVHLVLVSISMVLGAATAVIGVMALLG